MTTKQLTPFALPVRITEKDNKPCVDLRRVTNDEEIMRFILRATFNNQPVIFLPVFNNPLQTINTAINKGLIVKEPDGSYYLTF